LHRNGFHAYLVGGSIRDILLGKQPKDFDVATDAHPEQIKKIFHNCLLIGRRFRIAHIRFPGETIEVSTFRAAESNGGAHRVTSAEGILLRDNVYGSIHEDVWRRDFTLNALYYNIANFSLVDYSNALEDIAKRRIRMIGDPSKRYQEDPVRLLRAIRLAAKFPDFQFESTTENALIQQAGLLMHIPSGRLFEEVLKLFHSGHSILTYRLLQQYDLFKGLFPLLSATANDKNTIRWIETACLHTDQRLHENKTVSPSFLFSVLLWPALEQITQKQLEQGIPIGVAYLRAIKEVLVSQSRVTALNRICSQAMRDIWLLQPALVQKHPKKVRRLLSHLRFRAAYDFLWLRIECGDLPESVGTWWKKVVG
jgi:poly(A) polymerase